MKNLNIFLLGVIYFSAINAEEITNFRPCLNSNCTIHKVSINPCPEALDGNVCEIPLGESASMVMEFTPHFSTPNPKARFYGVNALIDVPLIDMDTNGCLYTSCPLQANVNHKFKYELVTSLLYPRGNHLSKLRVWDDSENAKYEDQCCIIYDVKLV
ncbi:uncharacterized protein LOC126904453 [Daktulosphaira vitifoliae]|uniref:uncharacterized protein LOC126904453 n=1 Tax=Daktulosphaira vitifoliae TaxID=58002 RepID=UPI0021A991E6|nr:uncharacterized protein LOC126904453 [Daktulosphaira vitifoliae]